MYRSRSDIKASVEFGIGSSALAMKGSRVLALLIYGSTVLSRVDLLGGTFQAQGPRPPVIASLSNSVVHSVSAPNIPKPSVVSPSPADHEPTAPAVPQAESPPDHVDIHPSSSSSEPAPLSIQLESVKIEARQTKVQHVPAYPTPVKRAAIPQCLKTVELSCLNLAANCIDTVNVDVNLSSHHYEEILITLPLDYG